MKLVTLSDEAPRIFLKKKNGSSCNNRKLESRKHDFHSFNINAFLMLLLGGE